MGRYTLVASALEFSQFHRFPDPLPLELTIQDPLFWPWNCPEFIGIAELYPNPWLLPADPSIPAQSTPTLDVINIGYAAAGARQYFELAPHATGRANAPLTRLPGYNIWKGAAQGLGDKGFLVELSRRLEDVESGLDYWMEQKAVPPTRNDLLQPSYSATLAVAIFGQKPPPASEAGVDLWFRSSVVPALLSHWEGQVAKLSALLKKHVAVVESLYTPLSTQTLQSVHVPKLQSFAEAFTRIIKALGPRKWKAYETVCAHGREICNGLGHAFGFERHPTGKLPILLKRCIQSVKVDDATVAALREAIEIYVHVDDAPVEEPGLELPQHTIKIDELTGEATAQFDNMEVTDMWEMLGFPNGHIHGLNETVCTDAKLHPWETDAKKRAKYDAAIAAGGAAVAPFVLLPHQLSAVLALTHWAIRGESGFNCDAVGMGKTIVALALFAVLNNFRDWYRTHGAFPGGFADIHHKNGHPNCTRINATCKVTGHLCAPSSTHLWCTGQPDCPVSEHSCALNGPGHRGHRGCTREPKTCPVRDGHGNLPDWPFLVTAPPTLVQQWVDQFWRFIAPGHGNIIPYTNGTGSVAQVVLAHVSDPTGMFHRLGTGRMFVIGSTSAIKTDFNALFGARTKDLYPDVNISKEHEATLFGGFFSVCVHDEVQAARNPKTGNYAPIHVLSRRSFTTIMSTATPITRSPADIMYLAAAGNHALARTQSDWSTNVAESMANLLKLERKISKSRDDVDVGLGLAERVYSSLPGGNSGQFLDPQTSALVLVALTFGQKIRKQLIRRSRQDVEPNLANTLPPVMRPDLVLSPGPWEEAQLRAHNDRRAEQMRESLHVRNARREEDAKRRGKKAPSLSARVMSSNFYLESRLDSNHTCLVSPLTGVDRTTFPQTKEDFYDHPSVKLSTMVDIIKHHQTHDAPPLTIREGELVPGNWDPPVAPGEHVRPLDKSDFKFVVYSAFAVALPLISRVLRVCGFDNIYTLYGDLSPEARRKNLDGFRNARGTVILLMTSVGVAGLNLQDADIMILLDANWSGSFDQQLVGRVYRQGQVCRTICYRLISMFTADYAIIRIGQPKEMANMAVLGNAKGLEIVGDLHGGLDNDEASNYLEEVLTEMDRLYEHSYDGKAPHIPRPPLALSTVPPDPALKAVLASA
ncbi:hypothetical protein EXIGLDRAFT_781430 [Exidia glandulosa HHB12029]|uniref:Helicase C-terminal domain-containing protein n=1 Tax=Exidia glandulosa HHB12029 TaxID=1314781 RepID=A0A165B962_EXIGL|nr:hypothetical protein EXIGLDRAFT_781430 [Exidia glandulosa HHB12029]